MALFMPFLALRIGLLAARVLRGKSIRLGNAFMSSSDPTCASCGAARSDSPKGRFVRGVCLICYQRWLIRGKPVLDDGQIDLSKIKPYPTRGVGKKTLEALGVPSETWIPLKDLPRFTDPKVLETFPFVRDSFSKSLDGVFDMIEKSGEDPRDFVFRTLIRWLKRGKEAACETACERTATLHRIFEILSHDGKEINTVMRKRLDSWSRRKNQVLT